MPRRSLRETRVLLTGASSGIGRELALSFAKRGARLWLVARRELLLRTLVDECQACGGSAEVAAGDVADPGFRRELMNAIAQRWDALDVLLNNAGVSAHGGFAECDEATLRAVMEVNFFAAVELTRLALPLLRAGRRPVIQNVASILAHRGLPLNSEYCASKFALRGWSESIRAELATVGIDVLLVSPGSTKTELFDNLIAKRGELPWSDSPVIHPSVVAEQAVRAIERNRREIFPNWRGRALVIANRLAPGLVDRVVTRMIARKPPR